MVGKDRSFLKQVGGFCQGDQLFNLHSGSWEPEIGQGSEGCREGQEFVPGRIFRRWCMQPSWREGRRVPSQDSIHVYGSLGAAYTTLYV